MTQINVFPTFDSASTALSWCNRFVIISDPYDSYNYINPCSLFYSLQCICIATLQCQHTGSTCQINEYQVTVNTKSQTIRSNEKGTK